MDGQRSVVGTRSSRRSLPFLLSYEYVPLQKVGVGRAGSDIEDFLQTECQRLLWEEAIVADADAFFKAIESNNELSSLVKYLVGTRTVPEELSASNLKNPTLVTPLPAERLRPLLHLFPRLEVLRGLQWDVKFTQPPLDPSARPALTDLWVDLSAAPSRHALQGYLNLDNLKSLSITIGHHHKATDLLKVVSADLEHLVLWDFQMADCGRLLRAVSRFKSLTTLIVRPQTSTGYFGRARLKALENLRYLTVYHVDPSPLLLHLPSLEILTVGRTIGDYEEERLEYNAREKNRMYTVYVQQQISSGEKIIAFDQLDAPPASLSNFELDENESLFKTCQGLHLARENDPTQLPNLKYIVLEKLKRALDFTQPDEIDDDFRAVARGLWLAHGIQFKDSEGQLYFEAAQPFPTGESSDEEEGDLENDLVW